MADPDVVVRSDGSALADEVAERVLGLLAAVQAEGRLPSLVLTGGTIADRVHSALSRRSTPENAAVTAGVPAVDWSRVEVWWGDERHVPADDPDRNALQARRSLLDHVPVEPARVHEVPAAGGGVDVDAAAEAYGRELREHHSGRFDLVMLGVGPDGHVASLFPGHAALGVHDRDTVAVHDSPKPPAQRVSLTFDALNRADEVWLVASGGAKAEAVARAAAGADPHQVPAAGVRGRVRTRWFLDEAAASRLAR